MSIKFGNVYNGDVLYSASRKSGNVVKVLVVKMDIVNSVARVVCDGQPEETYTLAQIERLRKSSPKS
jgi:hypothetical protein